MKNKKPIYITLIAGLVLSGCGMKPDTSPQPEITIKEHVEKQNTDTEQVSTNNEKTETASPKEEILNATDLLDSLECDSEPVTLTAVTKLLDENRIAYTGYYNQSRERVDITLEDGTALVFLETRDSELNSLGYELLLKGTELNGNRFQENYLNCYDVISDDFYAPDLSKQLWTEEELYSFNQTDLSIARNQIFAKYGRTFNDPFLRQVFMLKNWYEPTYEASEFDARQQDFLTEIELENLDTVIKIETEKGFRNPGSNASGHVKSLLSGSWLDLDGNGTKEQVIYQIDDMLEDSEWEEITQITFVIKQKTETETAVTASLTAETGFWYHTNCYVASMDGIHHYLILADNGPSSDYQLLLYQYENETIHKVGEMYTYPDGLQIYPDRITAMEEISHFQCQPVMYEYRLKNGNFVKQHGDYYEYRQNIVTALRDIPLYTAKDSGNIGIILVPGDKVQVMGGDAKEWVLLKEISTGEEGWLKVTDLTDCHFPDGSIDYSSNLFEGLTFYG